MQTPPRLRFALRAGPNSACADGVRAALASGEAGDVPGLLAAADQGELAVE
jgi:hypothetical protein